MTSAWKCVVALEGPCCAGKTTLGRVLARDMRDLVVAFVPCYADYVGGGRYLPRQEAESASERDRALRQLLEVEERRLARVPTRCDVVLEDRSVHTLLAHSYALECRTGIAFLNPSLQLLRSSSSPAWPDLVLYLDLPQRSVGRRNQGKFPPGSVYIDAAFNAAIRAYFQRLAEQKSPHVVWLDARLGPPDLARCAAALIRHQAEQGSAEGAT
jgi:thymidylate kinase